MRACVAPLAALLACAAAAASPEQLFARLGLRGGTLVASIGDDRFVIGAGMVLKLRGIALDGPAQPARAQRELAQLADGDTLRATVLRSGRAIEFEGPLQR
jgi:hypothetical protein